ncbi:MAG: hypothetical protein M3Y64_07950 [Gemmatimonadota bacterium]|nr:hypothetical protein [Gemmatimonadota bacterium]
MRRSCRTSFAQIAAGLFCLSVPLNAQRVDPAKCLNARQAAKDKHDDAMAELNKKMVDIDNEYTKAMIGCTGKPDSCLQPARDRRQQQSIKVQQEKSDESARDAKVAIDINRNECAARGPATAPSESEGRILATGDSSRLFKLGAEMNVIADDLAQAAQGNAGEEFLKGLADWAKGTIDMLSQKPGVPLQQMAQSIVDYLTNDNAANHAALLKAATQAVKEFEQNPARFIGQNLPNTLPAPGVLGKIPALRQLANVEKAAGRIKAINTAERVFQNSMTQMLDEDRKFGAAVGATPCFAENACFATARANAELFKTGGPLGNGTPVRINVNALEQKNMARTSEQIVKNLLPDGQRFSPRNPQSFTAEQLAQIAQGSPISVNSPRQILGILQNEGVGSQGLVFVQYHPVATPKPGALLGHVMNAERPGNAPGYFIDKTTPGVPPVLDQARVRALWFFPMQ